MALDVVGPSIARGIQDENGNWADLMKATNINIQGIRKRRFVFSAKIAINSFSCVNSKKLIFLSNAW